MNRRGFIRAVTTIIGGKILGLDSIISEVVTNYRNPISMYGIPYHCSNASTGEWLGIKRVPIVSSRNMRIPLQIKPGSMRINPIEEVEGY